MAPPWRRLRSARAITQWAHQQAGLQRVWLEINPDNKRPFDWRNEPTIASMNDCHVTAGPGRLTILSWTNGTTA
jgi:hypothetical protein